MDVDSTPPTSSSLTPTTTSEHSLYSTGSALKTFYPFPRLTPALRQRIWALAVPEPRTRFVELYRYKDNHYMPRIRYIPPLPAVFHATPESRQVSIEIDGGETIHFTDNQQAAQCYFNFSRDIVFLSSRFAGKSGTTETYRLRELSLIMPLRFLCRLTRILVTYSGLDSYERIGPILRPYARLEALYIGMMDWWSSRIVKRLLRKGNPAPGTVATKIAQVVANTEAEETDDDEETHEQFEKRLAVRQRRRIVEVEVRLDE